MLHNPIDSRSLYNWYDLTMRSLQPYSDYCLTLSKRFRRIADTMDLPVNLPFLSDMQKELSAMTMRSSIKYFRELTGYYYVSHMVTNIYEKPSFDIKDIKLGDVYTPHH